MDERIFDLIERELETVRQLAIFYDKPGLKTALAVIRNTRKALRRGIVQLDPQENR